jgi:hypothetical protein
MAWRRDSDRQTVVTVTPSCLAPALRPSLYGFPKSLGVTTLIPGFLSDALAVRSHCLGKAAMYDDQKNEMDRGDGR